MGGRIFLILGSFFGFFGVAIGAFAAHGLKTKLAPEMFQVFEVGVRYHMYHALALLAVAWVVSQYPASSFHTAGWLFSAGILIFSGSLYVLALTGVKAWGTVTPIGGLFFLAGWLALLIGAFKLSQ